jgi:hypothetical protein
LNSSLVVMVLLAPERQLRLDLADGVVGGGFGHVGVRHAVREEPGVGQFGRDVRDRERERLNAFEVDHVRLVTGARKRLASLYPR